jgi:excinuclease ABC subunit C
MTETNKSRASVPTEPGVYLLKGKNGRIIYVGKARNLRNRLRTYTGSAEAPDPKVEILRARLTGFDYIVTESETEALILESNLIKEHHPRYNVKLRDDKRYPFIKVTLAEDFPRAYVTRLVREDGSQYFGPYTDAKAMRRTLRLVRQIFPVRQCKTFRHRPRPCLNFQIGRCLGPCTGELPREEYRDMIRQLCLFLEGRADEVVRILEERMARASDDRRYEEAATLSDRLADIEKVTERQRVLTARDEDRDVVAVARHATYAVASVVRIRGGKLIGCENCPLDLGPRTGDDEVIETFLKQFYGISSDLPREILVDRELPDRDAIEAYLTERAGRKVLCRTPHRGEKMLLVTFARTNARDALRRSFESRHVPKVVEELQESLGMSRPPRLIAGIDISNISGTLPVGTVVIFRDGRPDKALYRKYRIKTVKGPDDYAMIREVVTRHFSRIANEELERPDLLLIDGGKGQLSAAAAAVRGSGTRGVALVALAKREEEVFVPGRAKPLPFEEGSRARGLLERVRDEVHRFSIAYHRSLRERSARHSRLDDVPGVGPSRKEALLAKFGSVAAIAERTPEEIAEVPGIGIETARRIREAVSREGRDHRPAG